MSTASTDPVPSEIVDGDELPDVLLRLIRAHDEGDGDELVALGLGIVDWGKQARRGDLHGEGGEA